MASRLLLHLTAWKGGIMEGVEMTELQWSAAAKRVLSGFIVSDKVIERLLEFNTSMY